jgi:squalene-associated FAD-dependent desaturase
MTTAASNGTPVPANSPRLPAKPPRVVVIGGGLAGMAAALDCADRGARVTLLEGRSRLGGLTWSFQHNGFSVDNGQHVFLRCCTEYLAFLGRIGASGDVELPGRLDVPVVAPPSREGRPRRTARLRRSGLPVPLHLLGSLLRYPHLPVADRIRLARPVAALQRMDLDDPALDRRTFGDWLAEQGQSAAAINAIWDLITVPTVNLPASEASLAMAAKVFKTGLLSDPGGADIGWSRVPLGRLHGERGGAALARAGVTISTGARVAAISPIRSNGGSAGFSVRTDRGSVDSDAVILAVPHEAAARLLPPGSVANQHRLADLGSSAIVDVHLVFDRAVSPWPLMAGHGSPVQFVFDRTASSGLGSSGLGSSGLGSSGLGSSGLGSSGPGSAPSGRQYLAVSVSAADELLGRHPDDLTSWVASELARLLPDAGRAKIVDSLVTKERRATFRATPGTAVLRPDAATAWPGLAVAGAWTNTGWPATMEGAVRSGRAAARACLAARPSSLAPVEEIITAEEEVA